jgi:hypothetical protein
MRPFSDLGRSLSSTLFPPSYLFFFSLLSTFVLTHYIPSNPLFVADISPLSLLPHVPVGNCARARRSPRSRTAICSQHAKPAAGSLTREDDNDDGSSERAGGKKTKIIGLTALPERLTHSSTFTLKRTDTMVKFGKLKLRGKTDDLPQCVSRCFAVMVRV